MIAYQVYRRHHDGKFIGWSVGKYRKGDEKFGAYSIEKVAEFYGKKAKTYATEHREKLIYGTIRKTIELIEYKAVMGKSKACNTHSSK